MRCDCTGCAWSTAVTSPAVPGRPRPTLAARLLAESPDLIGDDPLLACAIGDEAAVRRAIDADSAWVNRSAGLLNIPPLIAVTHSSLAQLDAYREALHRCLRLLLERGADPNQSFQNRWPPHSLEQPGDEKLTAIYGAAGKLHDEQMTRMLLAAGADANDNESLYHSIDDPRPGAALHAAAARGRHPGRRHQCARQGAGLRQSRRD